jgi:glycosyltransferase involved in cell wall biosynthesis
LLGAPRAGVVAPPAGDRFTPTLSAAAIRERATAGPLAVAFLGNVVERKGLAALVAGLANIERAPDRDVDWRLTVVGGTGVEPSYVARVRETAAEAGIAGRIRFTGRLADDAVAERLRAAHVLAVPSRYEPFGMAQLEAMGFGCVPLASAAGGTGEFVTDGESGFLVPPKDPDAVTDRICRLDDRERLAEMAVAARRAYEAWPTWTETLDAAVDFLSEVSSR